MKPLDKQLSTPLTSLDMNSTVDKFDLRKHMNFNVECISASWNKGAGYWEIRFRDLNSGIEYTRHAAIFISAVGGISFPRDVKFQGMDKFKGKMFHTARWDHGYDYTNKRVAIIGNGCSAAQVVPAIAGRAGHVKQYARSAQWYHERPNRAFTGFEKWLFKYIPFWQRYHRLQLFLENDDLVTTYMPGKGAAVKREQVENAAKRYIYSQTPNKYHHFIVPEFPLVSRESRAFNGSPNPIPGLIISRVASVVSSIQTTYSRFTHQQ
jgi:cation diffusion facilitator CzcD-associated flavoprotein CzcO